MSDSKGSRFFEGLVFGAIAGAAAGLLLAPRTGEETRKVVLERARDLLAKLDCALREGRDVIEIAIAEGQEAGEKTSDAISDSMHDVIEKAQEQP
jgi:gas vesicle protein